MTVEVDKKVWESLKNKFRQTNNIQVSVGLFEESRYGPENNNLPVAYIARIQDAGLGVPQRPFLSGSNGLTGLILSQRYASEYKKSARQLILNLSNISRELTSIGRSLVTETKDIVDKWTSPANSASTILKKGVNDPLVDSGTMRDSITFKIEAD